MPDRRCGLPAGCSGCKTMKENEMTKGSFVLGVLIVCLAGATVAQAILPAASRDGEISAPQAMVAPMYRPLDAQESSRVLPGWDAFTGSRGHGWMVIQYRDDLQTPATIVGPGIPVTATGASEVEITQAVRDFVTAHAGILKADPASFGSVQVTPLNATKTQVVLPQVYRGLAVVGGRVEIYLDEGKVVMMSSHCYPGIDLGVAPVFSVERAQAAAIAGVSFSAATDAFEGQPRLVIYPMILGGTPSYFLAWEMKFTTVSPVGYWWAYVDASDGEVLVRTNHVAPFDIPTTVKSDVQLNYPTDPQTELTSPDHFLQVDSQNYYTNADGFVNLGVPTADPYQVDSWIWGRYCATQRYTGEGPNATWSGTGTPGSPLLVKWDDTNSLPSERDAYYSVNRVHRWLADHDPTFTSLDYPMTTVVNRTNDVCNAYWNGSSINFYKEGGGCVNAATVSDVVMHEYGHAITQYTYSPDPAPTASGMGEALSDIVAQTITNQRFIGLGFAGPGTYIRDGENTRQYPGTSCGGEEHCLGEILMGAMWKTRTNVMNAMGAGPGLAQYDAMMRFAWKTKQTTMPDFLTKVLLGDDNNANVADGTPHYDEICAAFAIHNLPCPLITQYISFTHNPLADQSNTTDPISVTAGVQPLGCGDLVADSLRVHYSTDFGATWSSIVMATTGVPGEYNADLPAQTCGTLVSYYLRAVSTTGVVGTLPAKAPGGGSFEFMVGSRTPVHSTTFETDQGWTVGAPGDGATQGIWERVDPVGKANGAVIYQPEDDHTAAPGVLCYVTDGRGGSYLNYDVDGGATTLLSPIFDLSAASGACKLDFWAFFMNTTPVDDTLRASVSNDGGSSWFDFWKLHGEGLNAWTNYRAYFSSTQVPFTNQMRFRFQIADYNTSQTEGAIDDVVIRRTTCAPTGACCAPDGACTVTTSAVCAAPNVWQGGGTSCLPNPCPTTEVSESLVPLRFEVDLARPNPTSRGTTLRFALPAAGGVGIDLFDAGGRLVRTLARGPMLAGYHSITWDGNDAAGNAVASGVYYYQVLANGQELTRKVLVVR
jgi:hypothetical protein